MTLAPGLQRAVEIMQALIDAAPKHPLYDVLINIEAMEGRDTGEIIIGWRGKVLWTHEEYKRRRDIMLEQYKYLPPERWPTDVVPPPSWGMDIATSVFSFEPNPEGAFSVLRKLIDRNFLSSLTETDFKANNWMWDYKRAAIV